MGLGSFIKKIHDPGGVKKKIKKKAKKELKGTFLGNIIEFEDMQLKRWGEMLKENPERLFLGAADPLSSKLWGEITGKDYEAAVNMWGGPTQQAFAEAEAAGIDTSDVQTSHKIAEMVAASISGGALSGLAGQGAAATGSQFATQAAGQLTPKVTGALLTAGAPMLEDPIELEGLTAPTRPPPSFRVPTLRKGGLAQAARPVRRYRRQR